MSRGKPTGVGLALVARPNASVENRPAGERRPYTLLHRYGLGQFRSGCASGRSAAARRTLRQNINAARNKVEIALARALINAHQRR